VTALISTACTLALPAALGRAVDAIVAPGVASSAGRWLAVAAGLILVSIAAELVDVYAGTVCVTNTTAWLRNRLIRHVLAIGPEGIRRFDNGDLVARVSSNAADAAGAGPSVVLLLTSVLPPVGSLVLLAIIDFWLAAAFLAGVALVGLVLRAFARGTARAMGGYQRTQGLLAARLTESLAGARTIAAAGTVQRERQRVLEPLPDLRGHGTQTWRVLARTSAHGAVVGPLVLVAVLIAGGFALQDGRITPGDLFAASRYAVLGAGLGGLTGVLGRLARARAGARRAGEVLAVQPVGYGRCRLPDGTGPLASGRLEFRDVVVRADGATLLDGVSLSLPGGATAAVVGRSGSGKSVLAALAARLRDPDSGLVLLDGVPLDQLDHDTLRTAVGCAFERPFLVGATVADAIGLGHDNETVRAAARATHADEFISRLPLGYDTPLAEAPMSGGEAQRVGLARAWHAGRLLVLDDATSSLDTVTEMRIRRTLTGDAHGVTRLIVTHRAGTAARADLVVWLEAGRVRATGPHHRLWTDPEYRGVFG
jgi:ATP-binding cassette subfamily B protein